MQSTSAGRCFLRVDLSGSDRILISMRSMLHACVSGLVFGPIRSMIAKMKSSEYKTSS